jgi:tetratricopeptide (TPR) repeat protein
VRALLPWLVLLACFAVASGASSQTRDAEQALAWAQQLEKTGDAAGAWDAYNRALQASQPLSPHRPRALLGLATIEINQGKYQDARRHAVEAAGLFEQLRDLAQASIALNRLGRAALIEGDYVEAERGFRSAIDRSSKAGYAEGHTEQLGNLANVYFFLGRYADAGGLYQQALDLTTRAGELEWVPRRRRLLLINQATLYQRLGRDQEALGNYRAVGAAEDLRPRERAELLVNLGVLYRRLGDPIKTLATYDDARALFARDRDVDGELNAIKNRGIVLALDLNRLDEAERSFSLALETATKIGNRREMLHGRLYRGETALRAGSHASARGDFEAAFALARELKTPEEEWKALFGLGRVATERAQAVAFLHQAVDTIDLIREGIRIPSLRTEFLNDKRDVFDALIAEMMPSNAPVELFAVLERSHSRAWRERLKLERPVGLGEVQQALRPGTLLLDYWHSPRGAAVIAVTRERAAVFPLRVDEAAIASFVDVLAAGPSTTWRDLGAALGAKLLPPAEWLEGIDRLVIVPDGALALVPFDALSTDRRLIVERAAVSYTPTASTLLRSSESEGWLPPWKVQVEVFADPLAQQPPGGEGQGGALPASAEEARQVAEELGGRAVMHVGAENRKEYLVDRPILAPILHLATHAVADTSAMERSRIEFSSSDGPDGEPDYLFLKEAYALQLDAVELAVLSGCETERGRLVRGEGVQSFSRALLAAGADSTVTTAWRVADEPTADFMQVFYHHLARGEARDEALRLAKIRLLNEPSAVQDPHYWAAFVLTGQGMNPVPRAVTWRMVLGAAALLVGALAATIRLSRRKKVVPLRASSDAEAPR